MLDLKKQSKLIFFLFISVILFIPSFLLAAHNYPDALYKSIYYYGAQRCGNTKSWIHGACHTKDGQSSGGIDLTGGWHDCGDHVKFGQTNSYAAGLLLLAYTYFTGAYEDRYTQDFSAPPPNGIPDVLDEVKIHTDYLLKAYKAGKVYYQVGDGAADHTHFVTPDYESTAYATAAGGDPRNAYSITAGGSNVCGTAAAALALMSIAYRPYDSAYADLCLAAAINYYNVGKTSPGALSDPSGSFYGASHWAGHMAWGAIELYRATGTASYLTDAQNFAGNGDYSMPTNWVLCWNNCEPAADFELYKMTGTTTYLTKFQSEVTSYEGKMTTCGIGSYATVNNWGNLRYTGNMALCGAMLDFITPGGDANALSMCKKSVDFILGTHGVIGDAAQGESFLIGYTNPDYVSAGWMKHPHHRAAFGKTTTGDTDFAAESAAPGTVAYAYTLVGSLPGGPQSACGSFSDNIGQYSQTEGGIDYNAGIVGALAYMAIKYGPTPTNTPNSTATQTYTRTKTATATSTGTATRTATPSASPSATASASATKTNSPTYTPTNSATQSYTPSASVSVSPTQTSSQTFTPTRTSTYSPTPTASTSATPTQSFSPTFTSTRTSTYSPTPTASASATPTQTFSPTFTQTRTFTYSATPSATYSFTGTVSATPSPTITRTFTVTQTNTVSPTVTETTTGTPPSVTVTPTMTQTPMDTPTYTVTITNTVTVTFTQTPSQTATDTATLTYTPTLTYTATQTFTTTQPYTATQTFTSTKTYTATQPYTATQTFTITQSTTPSYTLTATANATATAQSSPTMVPTVEGDQTLDVLIYPDPLLKGEDTLNIRLVTAKQLKSVEMKIYTVSFRLIKDKLWEASSITGVYEFGMTAAEMGKLSNGMYYCIFIGEDNNGKKTKSVITPFVILR